jgi:hypothetical protein
VRADVAPEDARGSRERLVEAEQGIDPRRLARAVRPQPADGLSGKRGLQLFQDGAIAEADFQTIQFDNGVHSPI